MEDTSNKTPMKKRSDQTAHAVIFGSAALAVALLFILVFTITMVKPKTDTNPVSAVSTATATATDTDGDGVEDEDDSCPETSAGDTADTAGCSERDYFGELPKYPLSGTSFSESGVTVATSASVDMVDFHVTPELVSLVAAQGAGDVSFSFAGLAPNTTYYKYTDGYLNKQEITTDGSGNLAFTENNAEALTIYIKDTPGTRTYITQADCIADPEVTTNAAGDCVQIADIPEIVQIAGDLVWRGGGYKINPSGTGTSMFVTGTNAAEVHDVRSEGNHGISVQPTAVNTVITNFDHSVGTGTGLRIYGANTTVIGATIADAGFGVEADVLTAGGGTVNMSNMNLTGATYPMRLGRGTMTLNNATIVGATDTIGYGILATNENDLTANAVTISNINRGITFQAPNSRLVLSNSDIGGRYAGLDVGNQFAIPRVHVDVSDSIITGNRALTIANPEAGWRFENNSINVPIGGNFDAAFFYSVTEPGDFRFNTIDSMSRGVRIYGQATTADLDAHHNTIKAVGQEYVDSAWMPAVGQSLFTSADGGNNWGQACSPNSESVADSDVGPVYLSNGHRADPNAYDAGLGVKLGIPDIDRPWLAGLPPDCGNLGVVDLKAGDRAKVTDLNTLVSEIVDGPAFHPFLQDKVEVEYLLGTPETHVTNGYGKITGPVGTKWKMEKKVTPESKVMHDIDVLAGLATLKDGNLEGVEMEPLGAGDSFDLLHHGRRWTKTQLRWTFAEVREPSRKLVVSKESNGIRTDIEIPVGTKVGIGTSKLDEVSQDLQVRQYDGAVPFSAESRVGPSGKRYKAEINDFGAGPGGTGKVLEFWFRHMPDEKLEFAMTDNMEGQGRPYTVLQQFDGVGTPLTSTIFPADPKAGVSLNEAGDIEAPFNRNPPILTIFGDVCLEGPGCLNLDMKFGALRGDDSSVIGIENNTGQDNFAFAHAWIRGDTTGGNDILAKPEYSGTDLVIAAKGGKPLGTLSRLDDGSMIEILGRAPSSGVGVDHPGVYGWLRVVQNRYDYTQFAMGAGEDIIAPSGSACTACEIEADQRNTKSLLVVSGVGKTNDEFFFQTATWFGEDTISASPQRNLAPNVFSALALKKGQRVAVQPAVAPLAAAVVGGGPADTEIKFVKAGSGGGGGEILSKAVETMGYKVYTVDAKGDVRDYEFLGFLSLKSAPKTITANLSLNQGYQASYNIASLDFQATGISGYDTSIESGDSRLRVPVTSAKEYILKSVGTAPNYDQIDIEAVRGDIEVQSDITGNHIATILEGTSQIVTSPKGTITHQIEHSVIDSIGVGHCGWTGTERNFIAIRHCDKTGTGGGTAEVRIFDANDPDVDVSAPANLTFDSPYGLLDKCTISGWSPTCQTTTPSPADLLVTVRFWSLETGEYVYLKDTASVGEGEVTTVTSDFMKVYTRFRTPLGNFIEVVRILGAAQVELPGSMLKIMYPSEVLWHDSEEVYPFLFTSDSDWTVDVCLEVLEGYEIIEPGECVQEFVANQTKDILFKVKRLNSPQPNFAATIKARDPKGKLNVVDLDIPGIQVAAGRVPTPEELPEEARERARGVPFQAQTVTPKREGGIFCRWFGWFCPSP